MSAGAEGADELRKRTWRFGLWVLKAFRSMKPSPESRILGGQMLRSGTSVSSNYRASCRARSRREFVAKLGVVSEEADETQFWLYYFVAADMLDRKAFASLVKEADELVAIFSTSLLTARKNLKKNKKPPKDEE